MRLQTCLLHLVCARTDATCCVTQPHKQEMLQKTMRLLQDKVIKPFSGEPACLLVSFSPGAGRDSTCLLLCRVVSCLCCSWNVCSHGALKEWRLTGKHYKLEDAAEAIEASQKSGRGGKLFLKG